MFMRLLTLGVCIEAHNLFKGEVKSNARCRLEVILLVHIPRIILVLLGFFEEVISRFGYIRCPHVFTGSYIVERLNQCCRSHAFKCIYRLQIIPAELFHGVENSSTVFVIAASLFHLNHDSRSQTANAFLLIIQEGFVRIPDLSQNHAVHIIDIGQLLDSHVAKRCVSDSRSQLIQSSCDHRIIGVCDVRIIRVLNLFIGITEVFQSLSHLRALTKNVLQSHGVSIDLILIRSRTLCGFFFNQLKVFCCTFFRSHSIHVNQCQRICHSFLEVIRNMTLLILVQKQLIQFVYNALNLIPHDGLVMSFTLVLALLLILLSEPVLRSLTSLIYSSFALLLILLSEPVLRSLTSLIYSSFALLLILLSKLSLHLLRLLVKDLTLLLECLLALPIRSLISLCFLALQHVLQRLGSLEAEQLLVICVDAVSGLLSLCTELLESLRISCTLCKGKLFDLCIQPLEFLLFSIHAIHSTLVLFELGSLDIVRHSTLKSVCQQCSVGYGLAVSVGVSNIRICGRGGIGGQFRLVLVECHDFHAVDAVRVCSNDAVIAKLSEDLIKDLNMLGIDVIDIRAGSVSLVLLVGIVSVVSAPAFPLLHIELSVSLCAFSIDILIAHGVSVEGICDVQVSLYNILAELFSRSTVICEVDSSAPALCCSLSERGERLRRAVVDLQELAVLIPNLGVCEEFLLLCGELVAVGIAVREFYCGFRNVFFRIPLDKIQ